MTVLLAMKPHPSGVVFFSHKQKAAKGETATIYFLRFYFVSASSKSEKK
jgi:hypothetical protein